MNQSKIILIVIVVIAVLVIAATWWWGSGKRISINLTDTPPANAPSGADIKTVAQQEAEAGKGISTERVENPPVPTNVAAPGAQLPAPSAPAPIAP